MDTLQKILSLIEQKYPSNAAFEKANDLKPKTVDSWKRGNSKAYLKILPKLSKSFNVSTDYLLGNETKEKSSPELDELDAEFLDIISTMTKEQKQLVLKLAKQVID